MSLIQWLFAIAVAISHGYAAHYSPGLMERVANYRGIEPHGCMTVAAGYDIGEEVVVITSRGAAWCTVTDVVHPRDRLSTQVRRRIIVELDWHTARKLCGVREPPKACPVVLIGLKQPSSRAGAEEQ